MAKPALRRLAAVLWTNDRKTAIRLQHWSLSVAIYLACAAVMLVFVDLGAVSGAALAFWLGGVMASQAVIHALVRSGWSRRLRDPSMSQGQILVGIISVNAGYAIAHEARSAVLQPLMIILTFGAFALSWRRMVETTVFALLLLGCTILALHAAEPGRYSSTVDLANFLLCAIIMPATTAIAVLLGRLRERLHAQREDLRAALARIQDLAIRDELTGLANRRHAQSRLESELQRTARTGHPFSIALIDLDEFKRLNDSHGHAGGDAMLCAFAGEAAACAREIDLLARWGGEEFLLLMPGTGEAAAMAAAERLRLHVAQLRVPHAERLLAATCSAGVAEHQPGQTIAQTLLRADRALYRAKADGRDRVVLAPRHRPGIDEAALMPSAPDPDPPQPRSNAAGNAPAATATPRPRAPNR